MNGNVLFPLLLLLVAGCATQEATRTPAWERPAGLFPGAGLVTQHAILTVRGRQFVLNGYTALDASKGERLVVTGGLGQELGDVLVKPDGRIFVMRSSPMLRPKWMERYVAEDLRCVFDKAPTTDCPVRMEGSNHFVIQRRWYKLDLQVVAVQPGPQPPALFDETQSQSR